MVGELMKLRDMGYTHIRIGYSGGGDSGQIDEIEALEMLNGKFIDEADISGFEEIDYEAIESWVNDFMLDDIEDWWNNEGGFGHAIIDLSDLSYEIQNNIYVTHTESFNHSGVLDIDTEEI
jgi:hypothetical protein